MKISYNWLKTYLDLDYSPEELDVILTDLGLEVEGIEKFQSIKGGLEGVVIGEVLTCEKHPNADKLSKTTVDVGNGTILPIVCGAPNVAAGQKVVVATVGTVLYSGDDSFEIKKSKIRGEVSEGMICAEDELQIGTSHDGIMVLPNEVETGVPASSYFNVENDIVFEIGLTPNRVDAASHYGVVRDIAVFEQLKKEIQLRKPSVEDFKIDNTNNTIQVEVENTEACPRYAGVTISGVKVGPSPEWLQNRLKAIGLGPINNVVDITNFVLHETGQPLHAFDCAQISGNKVVVKTLLQGSKFVTLDEEERELRDRDLMICNDSEGMCIAGVFGGIKSGVSESTVDIFLESAYFHPVWVRKTAKAHGLNTDASFRFERGVDPNNTIYALKRAALLIKEIAGGNISSEIVDIYPNAIPNHKIEVSYQRINKLIGAEIPTETVNNILKALEIEILSENEGTIQIEVPAYRVDVTREADVIEEILRVYGYNTIEMGTSLKSSLSYSPNINKEKIQNHISDLLSANGYNEMMSNSLTKASYVEKTESLKAEENVVMLNPLSSDLNAMRQSLLFGGLEAVARNTNHQNPDLKLYEFGYVYQKKEVESEDPLKKYQSEQQFALFLSGNKTPLNWAVESKPTNFFFLKAQVEQILGSLGYKMNELEIADVPSDIFSDGLSFVKNGKQIVRLGAVKKSLLKEFDIKTPVFYAEFAFEAILKQQSKHKTQYQEISKFPEVKRDLALLLDSSVRFEDVRKLAFKTEKKLLKSVTLFDVYEGEKVGENKKSYAVNFVLQDVNKTLTDKQIDKIMNKLIFVYEKELNASLR